MGEGWFSERGAVGLAEMLFAVLKEMLLHIGDCHDHLQGDGNISIRNEEVGEPPWRCGLEHLALSANICEFPLHVRADQFLSIFVFCCPGSC